jgi:broad specificity phosphatase PhoE
VEIILMRHGRPILTRTGRIAPIDMQGWIEQYDLSVVQADGIPTASQTLADSAACIAASTAPRALSSLRALGHTPVVTDAIFCEAQLPFALWRFPRLPPAVWAALFRLLWFCGYTRGAASLQATQARAKQAAGKLAVLAEAGPVVLMGHGIMNRLIARELVALGWSRPAKHGSKYWSAGVYRRQA